MSHKGAQQAPKWSPKGVPKSLFLGVLAEVKTELPSGRELNFQSPGPPKTELKKVPKSEQPSGSLTDLTFQSLSRLLATFGRFWVQFWDPWGGVHQLTF